MENPLSSLSAADPSSWRCTYIDPQAKARLAALPQWLAPEASGATLLKENELRRVYRIETPDGGLVIKRHVLQGLAAVKARLLGNPAKREAQAAQYARHRGVPVARVLATAVRRAAGGRIVALGVAEEISDARPLHEIFESIGGQGGVRARLRSLGEALAELLVCAHRGAFLHPDGHPGNILVRERGDAFECFYIDVYGARCGRDVDIPDAARNLAAIQQWFALRTTRTQRLRVLKAYAAGRGWSRRTQLRRLVDCVARASVAHAFALYAERDRRIGRNNRWYGVERTKNEVTIQARRMRPSAAALFGAGAAILKAALSRLGVTSDSPHLPRGAEIDERFLGPHATGELVVPGSRWTALGWRLAGSPPARRFRTAAYAMHRDLPTVGPFMWKSRRGRGAFEEWWPVAPPGGESLLVWLRRGRGPRRVAALEAAARLVADSLSRGLIVVNIGPDRMGILDLPERPVEVYWDGVEGVTRPRPASGGQARWLLGELHMSARSAALSRADAARFLRAFARRRGEDWRTWWRMVRQDAAPGD